MNIAIKHELLHKHKTDALVIGAFENEALAKAYHPLDKALNKQISMLMKDKEFTGEAGQAELIHTHGHLPAKKLYLVGLGKRKEFTLEKLRRAAGKSAKALRAHKVAQFTTALHAIDLKEAPAARAQAVAEGTLLGLYQFKKYITVDKDKVRRVKGLTILELHKPQLEAVKKGVKKGVILAHNVNSVRDLVNEPADKVTPTYLAKVAKQIAKESKGKVKATIFNKAQIEKKKMGGLMGVSKGSAQEPKFIVLEYKGSKDKPVIFVGKGITFDSGGLDVKPWAYMQDMRCDMAGAATVLLTMKAAVDLGLKKHIVVIVPTCENMLGPKAMKQGDILTAYNGKTIELWHTDAEGRLILADGLSYAEKHYNAKAIIDVATLTGASVVALGYDIVSLMCSDEMLKKRTLAASEKTGEKMWELPLYEDYKEQVKGDMGDVRNMAKDRVGPGTITAGLFLQNFVEKTPWLHLDIGGAGWLNSDRAYKPKGGTGVALRTFIQMLEDW